MFKIFVSSTWLDLRAERTAVEDVLQRLNDTKFVGIEYNDSHEDALRKVSLRQVKHSHLYIGIIGGRYCSGITEAEYRKARERGCLALFAFSNSILLLFIR